MGPVTRSSARRSGQSQTEPPSKRTKISNYKPTVKATTSVATNETSRDDVVISTDMAQSEIDNTVPPIANKIRHFNVPREKGNSQVICEYHFNTDSEAAPKEETGVLTAEQLESTRLIFTHGAGGGLKAAAIRDFAVSFSSVSPVVCFEGSMNLASRVEGFNDVLRYRSQQRPTIDSNDVPSLTYPALGGRSMGARAAVLRAENDRNVSSNKKTPDRTGSPAGPRPLVLVSYPLNPPGKQQSASDIATRRGILLSIPEGTPVLLIAGSRDEFCSVNDLQDLVREIKAQVWTVVVYAMDHGMKVVASGLSAPWQKVSKTDREEAGTALRRETGKYAALWLKHRAKECEDYKHQLNSDRIGVMWWDWKDRMVKRGEGRESLKLFDNL